MAKHKSSKFGAADGFFEEETVDTSERLAILPENSGTPLDETHENQSDNISMGDDTEEIQVDATAQEANPNASAQQTSLKEREKLLEEMFSRYMAKQEKKPLELGETRGRKGKQLPLVHMRFSELNHEYLKRESRRRAMTVTEFLNSIVEQYRTSPEAYIKLD